MADDGGAKVVGGQPAKALPPIGHVVEPAMHHMSTRIRWYYALGYSVKEIAGKTGARYQQVRNVVTTEPKRAAREDLPDLTFELAPIEDVFEAMEHQALLDNMGAQRSQARRAPVREEDLDDEDYHQPS